MIQLTGMARTGLIALWAARLGGYIAMRSAGAPEDRALSARLYGGDHETRLRQEVVLGLGGVLDVASEHLLAQALLEYETLTGEEITELLKNGKIDRPVDPAGPSIVPPTKGSAVPKAGKRFAAAAAEA